MMITGQFLNCIEQPETTQNLIFLILSLQANILVRAGYHIGQKSPQNC